MDRMRLTVAVIAAGVLSGAGIAVRGSSQEGAAAGRPRFLDARVESRPVGSSLAAAFSAAVARQAPAGWIGYSVPAAPGDYGLCDADRPRRIYLEGRPARMPRREPAAGPDLVVLFRAEGGKAQRMRVASIDCEIDAGGLPVVWLDGAAGSDSVALLRDVIGLKVTGVDVREESAIMAIALHADRSAEPALERLTEAGNPTPVRRSATIWLGRSEDPRAVPFLERLLKR
jgi:hypothetical protein